MRDFSRVMDFKGAEDHSDHENPGCWIKSYCVFDQNRRPSRNRRY